MKTSRRNNILIGSVAISFFMASLSFANAPSCDQTAKDLNAVQTSQYNLKSPAPESKSLFELQKEYDQTLSEATIVSELHKLNEQFTNVVAETTATPYTSDDIASFIDDISNVTSSENLQVMRNMAAVDTLLQEMVKNTGLQILTEDGGYASVEQVIVACSQVPSQYSGVLCESLRGKTPEAEQTKALVSSFLQAFAVNNNANLTSEEKDSTLNAYRAILRQGIDPESDLNELFNSARTLARQKESASFMGLERIASLGNTNGSQVRELRNAQCCLASEIEAGALPICATSTIGTSPAPFDRGQCYGADGSKNGPYMQKAKESFGEITDAFVAYERRAYGALNFQFTNATPLDLTTSASIHGAARLAAHGVAHGITQDITRGSGILGLGARVLDVEAMQKRARDKNNKSISSGANLSNSLETTGQNIIDQIACIYRRGKLTLSPGQALPTGGSFSPTAANSEVDGNQLKQVANLINKTICNIENAKNNNQALPCNEEDFINQERYVKLRTNPTLEIVIARSDVLNNVFTGSQEELHNRWEAQQAEVRAKLEGLRQKIDAIKADQAYSYLDQLKSFMIWDMKNRCASNPMRQVSIQSCSQEPSSDQSVDYLIGSVGPVVSTLLAETDPETIARADIGTPSIAKRRIILGNMKGACLGLSRLNNEDSSRNFTGNGIAYACERITSMNTAAKASTDIERIAVMERKGQYIDTQGRIRRPNSTGKDIGLGMLRGASSSAGDLFGTYIQGRALSDSLPGQEQYWKSVKYNQYAQNWWMTNTPMFPSFPYMGGYSPYYGSPANYSSGFDFNQTGITSIP